MKYNRFFVKSYLAVFLICFLCSCKGGNEEQLPVDFVWDRVACEECKMALSDHHYSVQVIDSHGKAFFFDDIGCAIIWLARQPKKENGRVWVNDFQTGQWIDAETANWIYGDPKTPMGYGFAATSSPVEKKMDFQTVTKWMVIGKHLVNENLSKHLDE
ncbi:MAG: hypothetical protein GY797_35715 [Deltaproteobacteria bacterium]|nr:hypothetical protein [Deltaproteobacteria bacterium]